MRKDSKQQRLLMLTVGLVLVGVLFGTSLALAGGECAGGVCALPVKTGEVTKEVKSASSTAEPVLNTAALVALKRASVPVIILDARAGKYDDGKRIPGAQSLNAESPEADIAKMLPDKNALIVTYCGGLKCPASHQLAEHLKKAGYLNVVEYAEGIAGWVDGGNPVEEVKK